MSGCNWLYATEMGVLSLSNHPMKNPKMEQTRQPQTEIPTGWKLQNIKNPSKTDNS